MDIDRKVKPYHRSTPPERTESLSNPSPPALCVAHDTALGPKATLSEVARQVERETHVISKQAIRMEKDGLIKRTKNTPKSNLLKLN